MAAPITTGRHGWDLLYLPQVLKWVNADGEAFDTMYDKFYAVSSSPEKYAIRAMTHGTGLAQVKPEGTAVQYDDFAQDWNVQVEQVFYTTGFVLTMEAARFGHALNLAEKGAKDLRRSFNETRETACAALLNNGFSAQKTGDNVAMFSTSHTTAVPGTTYKNTPSVNGAMSESIHEQAIVDIANMLNPRGLKMNNKPTRLMVPNSNLIHEAIRQLRNTDRPATADRDISAIKYRGLLQEEIIVNPYLSSSTAFFYKCDGGDLLEYIENMPLEIASDTDFETGNAKYKGTMAYALLPVNPRGGYAVQGA